MFCEKTKLFALPPKKILLFILLKVMHLLHHSRTILLRSPNLCSVRRYYQRTSSRMQSIIRGVVQEIHKMAATSEQCVHTWWPGHEKDVRAELGSP